MTDPSRAQTVDTEIAKHCAYSLPGVALTLGRQNWHCLKDTYETLASDMQVIKNSDCIWMVRNLLCNLKLNLSGWRNKKTKQMLGYFLCLDFFLMRKVF